MREEQLHLLFNSKRLGDSFFTADGRKLKVLDFGILNKHSGPDFQQAKIKIDDKVWVGPIEFHLQSSDWYRHGHQDDAAYENVIAHFVLEHDMEIFSGDYSLPTIELAGLIHEKKLDQIQFAKQELPILCKKSLSSMDEHTINNQLEVAFEQRIERKSKEVIELLNKYHGDQRKTFISLLAKTLGGKVNNEAYEALVEKINFSMFGQINFDPVKTEALLLGLSGLLPEKSDNSFIKQLILEFEYQKKLFQLTPLPNVIWKTFAYRPVSSPVFRIAQLAAVLRFFAVSSSVPDLTEIEELLDVKTTPFWETNYNFTSSCKPRSTTLTNEIKNRIRINAVIPFQYAIAHLKDDLGKIDQLKISLHAIPPEHNTISKRWTKAGIPLVNAYRSQALIEQHNEFCVRKKCLFCTIGKKSLT